MYFFLWLWIPFSLFQAIVQWWGCRGGQFSKHLLGEELQEAFYEKEKKKKKNAVGIISVVYSISPFPFHVYSNDMAIPAVSEVEEHTFSESGDTIKALHLGW